MSFLLIKANTNYVSSLVEDRTMPLFVGAIIRNLCSKVQCSYVMFGNTNKLPPIPTLLTHPDPLH